mgnify:CR=1 FL=1
MLIEKQDLQQVANEVMNMLHEEEIEVFNSFHDAVLARDIEKIDEIFPVILFDVEDHFSTEERMMEENNYSNFQVHKNDHDTMREKLKKYHKRWEVLKSPKELQGFLETEFKQWLMLHISKWDSEIALKLSHAG